MNEKKNTFVCVGGGVEVYVVGVTEVALDSARPLLKTKSTVISPRISNLGLFTINL